MSRDALDFYIDLFPSYVTERDFIDYFIERPMVSEDQREEMENLAQTLRTELEDAGKWRAI